MPCAQLGEALSTWRTASLVPTACGDIVDDSQAGGGDELAFLFTMIHPPLRACLSFSLCPWTSTVLFQLTGTAGPRARCSEFNERNDGEKWEGVKGKSPKA